MQNGVFSLSPILALSAGALVGIVVFRKAAKEETPVQLDRQAAATVAVFKPVSSATYNEQRVSLAAEKDENKPREIKQQGKKTVKNRKHPVQDQVAHVPGESLEKTLQAAKEGNDEAQYRLGSMYARGTGVKKDMGEAYKWYRRAAGQGHEKARDAMDFVYE